MATHQGKEERIRGLEEQLAAMEIELNAKVEIAQRKMFAAKEDRGIQIIKRMDVRFGCAFVAAWRRRAYCGRLVRRLTHPHRSARKLLRAWCQVRAFPPELLLCVRTVAPQSPPSADVGGVVFLTPRGLTTAGDGRRHARACGCRGAAAAVQAYARDAGVNRANPTVEADSCIRLYRRILHTARLSKHSDLYVVMDRAV
jgi:hypothetical protein